MTARIAVWSGPRNLSTALMRSWENRSDTAVVDEPLYSYYLTQSGIDHPMRAEVIASQSPELDVVVSKLLGPAPDGSAVFYQKHMCHHLLDDTDRSWVPALRNVLLIRDPAEVVASYRRSRSSVTPADIGLPQQFALYELLSGAGDPPPIVDARDFLGAPEAYLRWLCDWAGLTFEAAMLSWPPGPRDSDGVWAVHWYASVLASTGFEPPRPRDVDLDGAGVAVVDAVRGQYEALWGRRIQV